MSVQNTTTRGLRPGAGRYTGALRHGRAHRAKAQAMAASIVTLVIATREPKFMDGIYSVRDATKELSSWLSAGGRNGTLICSKSLRDFETDSFRVACALSISGKVTLPTTVGDWKITKATPSQEAWARSGAEQDKRAAGVCNA